MKLKVAPVGVNYVHQTWPFVRKFVEDSLYIGHPFPEETASYKPEHVLQLLASGSWTLIVILDEEANIQGACTVSLINYPMHRVAFVTTYGGKFVSNDETMNQFKALMKSYGATKIQAICRDSMVRMLGKFDFEPRNVVVETLL